MLVPTSTTLIALALVGGAHASSHTFIKHKREVPQEHSHEQFLTTVRGSLLLNNPRGIKDPVFGLLGNQAAAGGANGIDVLCLQQATADQAFTNAKAKGDVAGMTAALVYRSLERNTPGVGVASKPCTSEKAANKEIAALVQHQDPASPNAAALNKASTLALAVQIAGVGGDPQTALKAGTFAPGSTSDNTFRGNTCDDQNDSAGCIFTQGKLVQDATPAEIVAAVAGKGIAATRQMATATVAQSTGATVTVTVQPTNCPAPTAAPVIAAPLAGACINDAGATVVPVTSTVFVTVSASNCAATPPAVAVAAGSTVTVTVAASNCPIAPTATLAPGATLPTGPLLANFQSFTGALGGILPPSVTVGGRGFVVGGEEVGQSDLRKAAALQRSCSVQHNQCANKANSGGGFAVSACDAQSNACNAAIKP